MVGPQTQLCLVRCPQRRRPVWGRRRASSSWGDDNVRLGQFTGCSRHDGSRPHSPLGGASRLQRRSGEPDVPRRLLGSAGTRGLRRARRLRWTWGRRSIPRACSGARKHAESSHRDESRGGRGAVRASCSATVRVTWPSPPDAVGAPFGKVNGDVHLARAVVSGRRRHSRARAMGTRCWVTGTGGVCCSGCHRCRRNLRSHGGCHCHGRCSATGVRRSSRAGGFDARVQSTTSEEADRLAGRARL